MADAITIKALQDASLDAKSLEEVVNGDEVKQVTTRKGETYPSVKKAITQMFENGGLPATPFATKALMTASLLVDGNYAMVTDDTTNNGLYVKTAGTWVKSDYDPLTQAAADATTKANTAEVNANIFSRDLSKDALKQGDVQSLGGGFMFADRRGIQTWVQSDEDGMPTDFTKEVITLGVLKNRLLHKIPNGTGFAISDRRGVAFFDTENYTQAAYQKYDLATVKFHGSSTMRFMQNELFTKLQNQFPEIKNALYTNKNNGGRIDDLATEIGINNGLIKFTDDMIYAATPSPVVSVDLKYGLPSTYDIPITLTNGIKGTLKSSGFVASNITSDFELPTELEINFKSDTTDYANCVTVVNLGKNNMSGSNETVVAAIVNMTRDAVSFLDKENGEHTLVIGHTTNQGSTTEHIKNVKDVNAQLKALYFKRYFGLFDYIFSDEIWIDTGLTKSSEDISAITAETLPPSLTNDGIHLNAAANSAVTTKIVQFIQTLGWY